MNRFNSYLPSQGNNTHPVLPRENAQAQPIGISVPADLNWPPQYAQALNTEAHPQHALPPSISDYTLESPEDALLYPQNIQSQPYHKRLIQLQTLLDGLETFYNNLGQPGSALKHHLTHAKSIRENLTSTDLLSRETRMAICATAHRVINMLVDPTLDTPTPETLSRFINQSCVFTINTDSPTKLLMPLVEHLSARATSATTLTTSQRPDQQSYPPEVTPPETQDRSIEHCFHSIANELKVLLSRFSGVEPGAQILQTAEQDMAQWLNALSCLQTARNNLARYDDHTLVQEKKLIECYIPVIEGAIVRLEYFITTERYTLTQSDIYRDLGDERKTAGAISATIPTHLPLLLNGQFSRCDNRDETASVNRLTQSTASIGLGGKLGPLQLSAGITGTRLHWYIYNTVKDFARALAEQDIDKRIKARIKNHFHDRPPTCSATRIDEPSPLTNPSRYLQQCRIQKQDQWSQQLEQLLMANDPRAQTHPGDYLVKHIQPTDSNYMSLTQHFIGFAKGTSALGGSITGDISRSWDNTTVYTPYYELFENNPALLEDPAYIYSEKNPTLWQTLTQSFAEHNLTNAFEKLERSLTQPADTNQNVALTTTKYEAQDQAKTKDQAKAETPFNTAENAPTTANFDRPRFDQQTTTKLKNIIFSGFLKLKNMTDRLQIQHECGTLPPKDKKILGHHWRQLQAECARLKRYYRHITTLDTPSVPPPHAQVAPAELDPHIMYIEDLERYMMQPRFKMDPRDYTASFFATEIAQGHTTNYLNTRIEIPLVIPNTPLTITPTFTVSRYHIENCGIPNLDGHYCDFSFNLIGSLTSEQLSDIMPVCAQRIIHQLSELQALHSGVTQALAQHLQSALSQHHNLDLTGATGIRFFWRFNPTQVISNIDNLNQHNETSHPTTQATIHQKADPTSHQNWHLQYHFISCQLAGGLDTQAPLNPITHLSPVNASVAHTQESGRRISLGDNTLKHIYRRFHSPYGFNKFWAWWQFLVDFRQQMSPLLGNLHRENSNIRRELDQLCDAIRNGIIQKGKNCQVTEAVLDTRIESLIAALKDFNDDDSAEHYQRATLALTNLLALDFEVLYFDRLLASYTLNLPADARKETIIRG